MDGKDVSEVLAVENGTTSTIEQVIYTITHAADGAAFLSNGTWCRWLPHGMWTGPVDYDGNNTAGVVNMHDNKTVDCLDWMRGAEYQPDTCCIMGTLSFILRDVFNRYYTIILLCER